MRKFISREEPACRRALPAALQLNGLFQFAAKERIEHKNMLILGQVLNCRQDGGDTYRWLTLGLGKKSTAMKHTKARAKNR